MDEPIIYNPVPRSSRLKKPPECLYDKLHNAIMLDDKDEFLRLIKGPGFEEMHCYYRFVGLFHRKCDLDMILRNDALQIAIVTLNGETKGIINDDELVFKDGWTPLHLASSTPSPRLTNYLIQRGDPVDVACHYYAPLNLKHATPLDLALEVIDSGYKKGINTPERPWTPHCSIFELLHYVCEMRMTCLEVVRLLVQNTPNKDHIRKAFFDYAYEGNLVKLAALFMAAPELFLSSSLGGDLSPIDTIYLHLNSLDKRTDIEDGLSLLLDVFDLVGHMLIACLRVDDLEVWKFSCYDNKYKIGFFLREAAHKKLGISSSDDYLLSFFKPVSQLVYRPPAKADMLFANRWKILPFKMKRKDIDIDYINRMIPSLKHHDAELLKKTIHNKLSIMSNICTLFEGMSRIPNKGRKQSSSFPCGRTIEGTRVRSFYTEAANAKCRLDSKFILRNGWDSRVMNSTKLESFFSAMRLSHLPTIAKCLIKWKV